jgi:hypothetical protein
MIFNEKGYLLQLKVLTNEKRGGLKVFQFSRAFGIPQIIFVFHKC